MCNDKKKSTIETVKENLSQTKEKLEKTLTRGDDTLCEYIKHIISGKNANTISSDGK
jgi:hypothetical protein